MEKRTGERRIDLSMAAMAMRPGERAHVCQWLIRANGDGDAVAWGELALRAMLWPFMWNGCWQDVDRANRLLRGGALDELRRSCLRRCERLSSDVLADERAHLRREAAR